MPTRPSGPFTATPRTTSSGLNTGFTPFGLTRSGLRKLLVNHGMLNEAMIFSCSIAMRSPNSDRSGNRLGSGCRYSLRGEHYKATAEAQKDAGCRQQVDPTPALGIPRRSGRTVHHHALGGDHRQSQEWLKGTAAPKGDVRDQGLCGLSGHAEGPARVLKLLKDIVELQPGEVLVCPSTNPPGRLFLPTSKRPSRTSVDSPAMRPSYAANTACRLLPAPVCDGGHQNRRYRQVDGDNGVVTIVQGGIGVQAAHRPNLPRHPSRYPLSNEGVAEKMEGGTNGLFWILQSWQNFPRG